jgi:phosphoribosylanthranilate isomerase
MTNMPARGGSDLFRSPAIKICGLSTPDTLDAALDAGADMVGFVRFPKSPRHVELDAGHALSARAEGRAARVLLLVDPDDAELDAAVSALSPDLIQLHGAETPERVTAVRTRTGRPVVKAVSIAERGDLARIDAYRNRADLVLLDAKPPPGAMLPGGNGTRFDWTLLEGLARAPLCVGLGVSGPELDPARGLVLSGGLTPENVGEAVRVSGLAAVDVSSGVETGPGVKDPARIRAFVEAARSAFAAASRREP